jgi:surfactin synthase thioesterase subunit
VSSAWLRCFDARPQARLRLFCFPYAGAGASVFRQWHHDLPPSVEVHALQLPGRENRLHEAPLSRMSDVVAATVQALQPLLDRPFALFGHSMGALLAGEVARALQQRGAARPQLLVLSARRAPSLPDSDAPTHALDHDAFVAEIDRRYGGIPKEVMAHRELMELLVPALRADMAAMETHRPQLMPLLDVPVHVVGGAADPRVKREQLEAWRALTTGSFGLSIISGDHFFINSRRAELLALVAEKLNLLLAAADGGRVTT